jgi:hypothetical protein
LSTIITPDGHVQDMPKALSQLSLEECRRPDSLFAAMVADAAVRHDVEPRALAVRTLLQLPRVAKYNGQLNRRQVEIELRRSAEGLHTDQEAIRDLIPTDKFVLKDLRFVELEAPVAEAIFGRLHYLRNARTGSLNYALVDPLNGLPVTMCSVSPLEWKRVARQVETQFGVPQAKVWDVSRVYSFDIAPPNAISCLLAKVRTAIRQRDPQVDLLSTAVDPNLGFHGSSYRAANWQRWMSIQARPYLYVDRIYASPRQLRQRFATTNLAELAERHGAVVEQSRARLLDSLIFCCRVRRETEQVAPDDQRRLRR